jgi:hypothetical protein
MSRFLQPARKASRLVQALDNPENARRIFEKLKVVGHNYKGYLEWSVGPGAVLGGMFSAAHMADVAEERKLSNKEKVAYPVAGLIGGGFLGATAPVWIVFAPVGYVFGYDNVAALAKVVLAGVLLGDEKDS